MTIVEILFLALIGVMFIWIALLEWRMYRLTRALRMLLTGRGGADLELTLRDFLSQLDHANEQIKRLDGRALQLEAKMPFTLQHVGIVRFNPFADRGGDLSFVVALLDDRSDGVVVSSLHSRNDSKLYAKPIIGGNSTYPLTDEEKEAIQRALGKTGSKT